MELVPSNTVNPDKPGVKKLPDHKKAQKFEYQCKVCGKEICKEKFDMSNYRYKKVNRKNQRVDYYCSWGCMRQDEKKEVLKC